MATQAAYAAEKLIGHQSDAVTAQDVTNYSEDGNGGETMKALTWQGKDKVKIGESAASLWSLAANAHFRRS